MVNVNEDTDLNEMLSYSIENIKRLKLHSLIQANQLSKHKTIYFSRNLL